MTESNAENTPFSILANELLVEVLGLTHPRSTIPAASAVTKCIAQDNPHIARSWAHHIIFHASHLAPIEAKLHNAEAEFFEFDPAARQLESRLSTWLKMRLSNCSNLLAPTEAQTPSDPVLTAAYVDWLFSAHGPIQRDRRGRNRATWQSQLDTLCGPLYTDDEDYPYSHPARLRTLPHMRWHLVPDTFQLAMYFARSGHVDLLQRTLVHLHALLPDLAVSALPLSRWTQLALDTRPHVRTALNLVIDTSADARVAFPAFACFVGALDWSQPAMHAAASVFPDAPDQFTAWLNSCGAAVRAMFDTLGAVTDADRAVRVLAWMYAHGLERRPLHVEDHTHSPFMALSAGNARVFGALLTRLDVPHVLPAFAEEEGLGPGEAERRRAARERLGEVIVWWAGREEEGGSWEWVEVVLDRGVFGPKQLAKLLVRAAERADEKWMAKIMQHVKQSPTAGDVRHVVYTALKLEVGAPSSPTVRATLRSQLHDPVDGRTQYLLANLDSWTDAQLPTLVLDSDDPPFSPADHARFVTAWLHKIMDKQVAIATVTRQATVLARVFARALTEVDLGALPVEALAFGAALSVVVLSGSGGADREAWSERQAGVLHAIAVRCRAALESKRVACRVSEGGVRELKPTAVELLRTAGGVLDRFAGRGAREVEVSVNRLVFDFGLALRELDENELVGT